MYYPYKQKSILNDSGKFRFVANQNKTCIESLNWLPLFHELTARKPKRGNIPSNVVLCETDSF